MIEFPKIQTVYLRDPATNFKSLLKGQWAKPEFAYLAKCPWRATEKVDGTNIRVVWSGGDPAFAGKTDDAQMPPHLLRRLAEVFTRGRFLAAFPEMPAEATSVCLYGEGYGVKIQKGGGRYIPTGCDFILFDVRVDSWWLEEADVEDVARKLGIRSVPTLMVGTLAECVEVARAGFKSRIASDAGYDAEGLVMRPTTTLFNRKGERVIAKIKHRDFALAAV